MQDIYKVETHPLALRKNDHEDKYRITFLTEGLIRLSMMRRAYLRIAPRRWRCFSRDFSENGLSVVRTEDGIEVHTEKNPLTLQ